LDPILKGVDGRLEPFRPDTSGEDHGPPSCWSRTTTWTGTCSHAGWSSQEARWSWRWTKSRSLTGEGARPPRSPGGRRGLRHRGAHPWQVAARCLEGAGPGTTGKLRRSSQDIPQKSTL